MSLLQALEGKGRKMAKANIEQQELNIRTENPADQRFKSSFNISTREDEIK